MGASGPGNTVTHAQINVAGGPIKSVRLIPKARVLAIPVVDDSAEGVTWSPQVDGRQKKVEKLDRSSRDLFFGNAALGENVNRRPFPCHHRVDEKQVVGGPAPQQVRSMPGAAAAASNFGGNDIRCSRDSLLNQGASRVVSAECRKNVALGTKVPRGGSFPEQKDGQLIDDEPLGIGFVAYSQGGVFGRRLGQPREKSCRVAAPSAQLAFGLRVSLIQTDSAKHLNGFRKLAYEVTKVSLERGVRRHDDLFEAIAQKIGVELAGRCPTNGHGTNALYWLDSFNSCCRRYMRGMFRPSCSRSLFVVCSDAAKVHEASEYPCGACADG